MKHTLTKGLACECREYSCACGSVFLYLCKCECACACVILSGFVARRLSAKMSILLESQPQLRLRLRCSLLRLLVLFSPHCAAVAVSVGLAAVVVVMNDAAFGRVFCLDGTIYKTQTLAATANGENKNI